MHHRRDVIIDAHAAPLEILSNVWPMVAGQRLEKRE